METKHYYSLNTGGNCMIYAMFTGETDESGCSILSVWDNFTESRYRVPLSKYAQSFEIGDTGDPTKFYLSEFIQESFYCHGAVTICNSGGYLVELSNDGEGVRMLDAYGSEYPVISEWLQIEHVEDEVTGELIPVIDPDGYNIRLDRVVRL